MILIITRADDVHADLVIRELKMSGVDFFRLNTERISEYSICLGIDFGLITHIPTNRCVHLDRVTAVYLRRRAVPENLPISPDHRPFVEEEWRKLLSNISALLDGRYWINQPSAVEVARDKIRQLSLARHLGFEVPDTVMTNDITAVRNLCRRYPICAYKPFDGGSLFPGSGRSVYTSLVKEEDLIEANKEVFRVAPGIFQEYIEKDYELRVTIVRDNVYSVRIESQQSENTKIDWRHYDFVKVPHISVTLDPECQYRCVALLQRFNLQFGAIDLIRTPDGRYVFLEINPNGQWAWLEGLTQVPISKAIAEALIQGNVSPINGCERYHNILRRSFDS